uniref:Uncharacterized protein n=1 Tax=Kalanchoe fedtschenkoi TaxID=63787 RepID=A0A7N0TG80_KALFE
MGESMWQRKQIQPMSPLVEGPGGPEQAVMQLEDKQKDHSIVSSSWEVLKEWFRNKKQGSSSSSGGSVVVGGGNDMRLVLGVLACPLAPIPLVALNQQENPLHLRIRNVSVGGSGGLAAARYIIQQYLAATGCLGLFGRNYNNNKYKNMYSTGDVKMSYCETEISTTTSATGDDKVKRLGSRSEESGCFVLWMMSPATWSLELVVGGRKVVAGSDGNIVWRHTPWLGTHAAKGPHRPLRRIIQGLDPKMTACLFEKSEYMGEDSIGGESCFVVKVEADRIAVKERSEGSAEVIRHTLYGYFSQKSGLLIYIEDSQLTRVASGADDDDDDGTAMYWETTMGSSITDYRDVDGILIAHQGRTIATVFKFGNEAIECSRSRLEEEWTINDVAFDVPGLSLDYFIPPADIFPSLNLSSS